jgi:hypothetical protein
MPLKGKNLTPKDSSAAATPSHLALGCYRSL